MRKEKKVKNDEQQIRDKVGKLLAEVEDQIASYKHALDEDEAYDETPLIEKEALAKRLKRILGLEPDVPRALVLTFRDNFGYGENDATIEPFADHPIAVAEARKAHQKNPEHRHVVVIPSLEFVPEEKHYVSYMTPSMRDKIYESTFWGKR